MHQTDILVIGGGIAGTATACHLAQYGRHVTLLEQSELAAEASGLNAGTLWATGWGHTPDLSSTLSMGSLEVFKTLQLDLGYDLEFRQGGSFQAIQTEEEYAFAQQEVRELLTRGHQVELLDGRDNGIDVPDASHLFLVSGSWIVIGETIETLLVTDPLDDLLESEAPLEQVFGRYAAGMGRRSPSFQYWRRWRSGCHRRVFCYVYDVEVKFLADLRNQEYVCSKCREKVSEQTFS